MLKLFLTLALAASTVIPGGASQVLNEVNNGLTYVNSTQAEYSTIGNIDDEGGGGESSSDDSGSSEPKNQPPGCYAFTAFDFYLGYHKNVKMYGNNFGQDPEDELNVQIASASASTDGIVDFYVEDGNIFITPAALGETWIAANIYDSQGAVTRCSALFRVKLIPGINIKQVEPKTVQVNKIIDVSDYELARSEVGLLFIKDSTVSDKNIANVQVRFNKTLRITGIGPGETTVITTVYNMFGVEADVSFDLTVTDSVYGN